MGPLFFESQHDFRKWLEKNHSKETELYVGYYKISSGKATMTWSESVDQALCFGWIDGVRKSIDKVSYSNRFTPRRTNSNWSAINIKKVDVLLKAGMMTEAGIKAFGYRTKDKSDIYSYENAPVALENKMGKHFKNNKIAWVFFSKQAPSYIRLMIHWVMSAKQEKTRWSRMEKLILFSEEEKRVV